MPGLEQKRETARLIIIALPEGSIRRTDCSDAQRVSESQLNLTQTLNKALAARVVSNGTNEWLKLLVKGESVTHPPQSWANFGYLISGWGISANTFIVLIYLEYKTPKVILLWCSSAQTLLPHRFSPQKQMDQSLYGARFTSGVFLWLVRHTADIRKWCIFSWAEEIYTPEKFLEMISSWGEVVTRGNIHDTRPALAPCMNFTGVVINVLRNQDRR